MLKKMKMVLALLALAGTTSIAIAGEPVVLKDTSNLHLVRQDGVCAQMSEYEKDGILHRDMRSFECDGSGKETAGAHPVRTATAKAPDYYLEVEVLGYRRKVAVHAGAPIHLNDAINYAYAGACSTAADSAAVAGAIYAGKDGAAAASAVQQDEESRAPHAPASNESVQLKSGVWEYQIDLVPSAIAADGTVHLEVSGVAKGPEHYDPEMAGMCNGFKPHEIAEKIPHTSLLMLGGGVMSDLLLGPIKFRVVKS